jgi:hypothetical protein
VIANEKIPEMMGRVERTTPFDRVQKVRQE